MNTGIFDPLRYVQSSAIRRYLKDIGHRFTPLETAVLIRNNELLTLREQLAAWQELMDCTEDMPLPVNEWFPVYMSLHEWLKEDLYISNLALERFEREEPGAVWYADNVGEFPSWAACADALRQTGGTARKECVGPEGEREVLSASFSPGGGYWYISAEGSEFPKPSSLMGLLSFWIDVPTPFRKGDLLQGRDGGLFILLDDRRWHMTREERWELLTNGSFMDMDVSVMSLQDNSIFDYMYLLLDYPEFGEDTRPQGTPAS